MDLSAIGCLLEQAGGNVSSMDTSITVTGPADCMMTSRLTGNYHQVSTYLSPRQAAPPPYPAGLTPYQTPYVSPYTTPFQTPSPSPLSSVQSSPATSTGLVSRINTKGPGIDQELAMILESDPFIWEQQPGYQQQPGHQQQQQQQQSLPPPPYPRSMDHQLDRVTGRPPHARPSTTQPSRTQLKQQLQRQQLEQQERREREMMSLHQSSGRSSSCPSEKMSIPIPSSHPIVPVDASVSVPAQVLKVQTRLENPTLYHVMESRKRQVREFLQQEQNAGQSDPLDHRPLTATVSSAPAGGFVVTPSDVAGSSTAEVETIFFCSADISAILLFF